MKHTKQKRSRFLGPVLALSVLAFATIALNIRRGQVLEVRAEKQRVQSEKLFWQEEIFPIQNQLSHSNYPIPCLNAYFGTVAGQIREKYAYPMKVVPMATYHPKDKEIMALCRFENGKPVALLSVPCAHDMHRQLKGLHPRWKEEFQILVGTLLSHEADHLVDDSQMLGDSFEELIRGETRTWANTCKYVLTPLMKEGRPIPPKLMEYQKAWITCGSNTNAQWEEFIRKKYAFFKDKSG